MTTQMTVGSPIEGLVRVTAPKLIVIDGPIRGHTFYLDEPTISMGRRTANNICIKDWFISRHHCVIRNQGNKYVINDLNSANGTYVNGERVNAGSLEDGFLIEIGVSRILFRLPENLFNARDLLAHQESLPPAAQRLVKLHQ